jgi:hypothetical protein
MLRSILATSSIQFLAVITPLVPTSCLKAKGNIPDIRLHERGPCQVLGLDSFTSNTQPSKDTDLAPDQQSTCETQTTSRKQSDLAQIESGQGGRGCCVVGELTAVSDEKQLDEVVVVGPSPRRRRRHPALPPNP